MSLELSKNQLEAIDKMKNGSVLVGDVGTGKSRTALAYYYFKECQGSIPCNGKGCLGAMKAPRNLVIITTPKKRDSYEWLDECIPFGLHDGQNVYHGISIIVDSWNNIKKYVNVYGAFFIFDEQRVCGSGVWVKAFLKIARKNRWILLSATPGDQWIDYVPIFVANGFFKNKTDFINKHVVYNPYCTKFKMIDHYVSENKLEWYQQQVLIHMKSDKVAKHVKIPIICEYNRTKYNMVWRDRWDPYDNCPIEETGKLFYLLRKVVNEDQSRLDALDKIICDGKHKLIVFYNHTYECENIKQYAAWRGIPFAEWNGQRHETIPDGEFWIYAVQYAAGAEGWNCITTDTIVFYSQNYSYKATKQAAGRIDRMNTPFKELYYYTLRSHAPIDDAIHKALTQKKKFNEKYFMGVK